MREKTTSQSGVENSGIQRNPRSDVWHGALAFLGHETLLITSSYGISIGSEALCTSSYGIAIGNTMSH